MKSLLKKFRVLSSVVVVLVASMIIFGVSAPAYAATHAVYGASQSAIINWPTPLQITSFVATVVLPVLVGLVTNSSWSSQAKYVLHLVLSIVVTGVGEFLDVLTNGGTFDVTAFLFAAAATFAVGVFGFKTIGKALNKNGNSIASTLAGDSAPVSRGKTK